MSDMTDKEREAAMAQAMGVPVPAQRPMIGPPAGPPPPPAPIAASPEQQSTDPNAPNYVNPQSPYYKSPNARGAIPLGNASPAPAQPAPPPADPNKYAQQSTDPKAPFYVSPQSPFYNPHAPKPTEVLGTHGPYAPPPEPGAPVGPPNTAAGPEIGNKYAKGAQGPDAAAPAPGINWGSVGGSMTIPAHEVPLATAARQGALMGAIDAQGKAVDAEGKALEGQQSAAGAVADANADVERARGVGEIDQAKASLDAGQGVKERAAKAADESKVYRTRIDEFSEKLARDKIDPNGMWNSASVPQKITWTLAKMLGATAQAFLHLPTNQVADELERMAAQDVATQKANHEIGREHLADMNTMYGQALHATGNAEEAERVATGYALEAIKHQAQGFVNGAQSKVQEAKGKEFITEIGARIAANGERRAAVDEKKAEKGIAMNPLAQARTVSSGPDMNKVYATARDRIKDQASDGHIISPDEAIRWAYKLHTGRDPLPGAGAFAGGAKGDPANKELRETQTATDEFNKQVDDLRKHPVITGSGLTEAALSNLPQRIAPESNDAQQQLNAINTRMLQAIGKVAKDADGKPNKTMIEKIEKNFEIHLGDSPAIKQQKLQGVADVYNSLAREQGARAPEPTKGPPPGLAP